MRRVVILSVLVVVLVALIGLRNLIVNYRYVVSGPPGTLLYAATFDNFTDEWSQHLGALEAQVSDGVMRLDFDKPNRRDYTAALPNFADFDLRVEARAIDGPPNNNNGFGVVFRVFDTDNYYLFLISSDGYYQVVRRVGGQEKTLSAWIPSPLIHQGLDVTNWIRVVGTGSTFNFYVNGQQVDLCVPDDPTAESTYDEFASKCVGGQMLPALTDSSLGVGQIGLTVQTLNETQAVIIDFDNVLVYSPEAQS